ncbi:hypothetical protein [Crateriforma conspicua]|uniref:Oxaloacetate decarboxylase, gamma chain n=1 Tax=Crateriforma conspicua TaxID=2527996 RepID=A0A5C5Y278_9PLAN|nr:hypothetical protein [Crateriforma conspicua]QDV62376.1 hypothetical protein Mal65_15100 [Crateriforma conspicua]TWT68753.1 hypothetical protein Pan14r_10000 [Crateriforma conspicua]
MNVLENMLAYIGPGIGIGGLVLLLGFVAAGLFLVYAFAILPLQMRRRRQRDESKPPLDQGD